MTKEEILPMEAGEELDRLMAIEVMGEPIPEFTPENALYLQLAGSPVESPKGNWLCLCSYDEGDIPTWRPLPYSTDISVAWLVVEKFTNEKYNFALVWCHDHWGITIDKANKDGYSVKSLASVNVTNKAPEAICKAALLAKLEVKKKR